MSWVSLKAQWAIASGAIQFEHKTTSVDDCEYSFEISVANLTQVHDAE